MNESFRESQPDFERLRTVLLRRGESDRVPLFEFSVADVVMSACLGRPVHDPTRVGITLPPPPVDAALGYLPDYVAFFAAAGYDFLPIRFGITTQVLHLLERGAGEGSRRIGTAHAPTGREWAAEHDGFITSWADMEAFPWPQPADVSYAVLEAAGRMLPAGMRLIAHASGLLMAVRIWMGFERFWTALGTDATLVVALLERMQARQLVAIDRATDDPAVGAFLLDDDLAHCGGLLESPKFLRAHVFPFYRKVGELVHSKGLPLIMHSDGDVTRVLPDLIACGLDAFQPVEPKAMDIVAVKREYGDRLALLGNVDVDLLARGSTDEIRNAVERLMRDVAPGGGFAIGSANSIPDYVPAENYRALVEASLAFGRYPITEK